MIKIIEEKNRCMDFKIEEENFEIIMILFGNLYRKERLKKIKQIFQLFMNKF